MSVQSVLVEYSEAETLVTVSAILFNKRWILLPAASLIVTLSSKKQIPDILQNLEPSKLFYTNYLDLQQDKLKIIMKSETSRNVLYLPANYLGIFCCKNIKDTTNFPLGCGDGKNNFDSYLSLFIFLDLKTEESGKFEEKHLYEGVSGLLRASYNFNLCRGNTVCVESTPFGSRELLSSYSQGVVCNCVGENNCYILTDAPTAPGSEGAPIFGFRNDKTNSTKIPIGIVISSINWWRGEHTGLTLGATLVPLLSQLLPKKWNIHRFLFSDKNSVMNSIDKSIVQVFCGNGWGTGILIDKANGIFITGSHVVKSGDPITLKWRNRQFPCTLAYRTPGVPIYDIAVLRCLPQHIPQMSQVKFATKPAIKGENVLAAGYPIFNSLDFIFPVITKGNISLTDSCILHTTCCILAGSSGGAIFRENGELLGIIVCHTTVTVKNEFVVYPKINMAIPISAISKPLLEYIRTKDIMPLATLDSKDPDVRNKWQSFQSKL